MKVLIVNAGRNENVRTTAQVLRETVGKENVDLIEYGWEGRLNPADTTPYANTIELSNMLRTNPPLKANYDLLLVSGGHGDARLRADSAKGFSETEFNSLTPQGAQILINHFKKKNIRFDHILLGTCFSVNFQQEFKTLLNKPEQGTILSFTSISPHNLCSLAENMAKGLPPDMDELLAHGVSTVMIHTNEISTNGGELDENYDFIERSLTPLEQYLLSDYEPLGVKVALVEKMTNFVNGLYIEYPQWIGDTMIRMREQQAHLLDLGLNKTDIIRANQALEASLTKLNAILLSFVENEAIAPFFFSDEEKKDGDKISSVIKKCLENQDEAVQKVVKELQTQIDYYNQSRESMAIKGVFSDISKTLHAEKNKQLFNFLQRHYKDIAASEDLRLKTAIESTVAIYQNNVTFVMNTNPQSLPADVISASDPQEIPEQLDLIVLELAMLEQQGSTLQKMATIDIPTIYADLLYPNVSEELFTEEEDDLFAVPDISGQQLASATQKPSSGIGRLGLFSPKQDRRVPREPGVLAATVEVTL